MPDPKHGRGVQAGLLCGIAGLVIGLATIVYVVANKEEFLYVDSSGLPAGPLSFVICCAPLLLLAAILCTVGILSHWRSTSQRKGFVRDGKANGAEPGAPADQPSGLLVKVARVFAGVLLGGLLGVGFGVLALVLFPRDHFPFSSDGMFLFFFGMETLVASTVVGVALGILAAFSPDRHCLVRVGMGATVGLAGAVGAIVVLPRALAGLRATGSEGEVLDRAITTIIISLLVLIVGAVIGRRMGARGRAEPGVPPDRPSD